jgi:heme-degrading monooxygenase HmoA
MYVVMNRLSCPASYAEHLERAFRHAGNLQNVPGFASFMFLRRVPEDEERRHFVAVTTWEDRQSYDAWLKSEAFAAAHAGASAGPIESSVDRYELLE